MSWDAWNKLCRVLQWNPPNPLCSLWSHLERPLMTMWEPDSCGILFLDFNQAEKGKGNLLAGNKMQVFTCEINRQHKELFTVTLFHNIIFCLFGCWVFYNLISKNKSKGGEERGIKAGASHRRLTMLSNSALSPLFKTVYYVSFGSLDDVWFKAGCSRSSWRAHPGEPQGQLRTFVRANSSSHPSLIPFQKEHA